MTKFPVVLDVETKHTFREFNDQQKLGISVAVIYDYADKTVKSFFEKDLSKMFPILENASYLIGYNIKSFDMQVVQGYYPGKVEHFSVFDMLDDIREKLGRRLALNDLIHATLGKKKTGHGLMAIDYYKEGKFAELEQYCGDDVRLTQELFEYGVQTGEIYYFDERGKSTVKVDWRKYKEEDGVSNDMPLTLPF